MTILLNIDPEVGLARIMKNRQDFILKNQKNTIPSNPSFDELMFSFDEENFSNF